MNESSENKKEESEVLTRDAKERKILVFLKKNLAWKSKLGYTNFVMSQSELELIAEVKTRCRQATKSCGNY